MIFVITCTRLVLTVGENLDVFVTSSLHANANSDVAALVKWVRHFYPLLDGSNNANLPLYIGYERAIGLLRSLDKNAALSGRRLDLWLVCTELGGVPTTDYTGYFSPGLPTKYGFYNSDDGDASAKKRFLVIFSAFVATFSAPTLQPIPSTSEWRKRMKHSARPTPMRLARQERRLIASPPPPLQGTNVFSTRGSVDPARGLGLVGGKSKSVVVHDIEGEASSADTRPRVAAFSKAIEETLALAESTIDGWFAASARDDPSAAVELNQSPPPLTARRAPERETTICWNCGDPEIEASFLYVFKIRLSISRCRLEPTSIKCMQFIFADQRGKCRDHLSTSQAKQWILFRPPRRRFSRADNR